MTEYINKAELIDHFDGMKLTFEDVNGVTRKEMSELCQLMAMMILEEISHLPTIDIVHCSECIHWNAYKCCDRYFLEDIAKSTSGSYFCADGEREETK